MKSTRPSVQFWDYVRIVLGHGWVVLLCTGVVCAAVWYNSKDKPILYEASGQLELRPSLGADEENLRAARIGLNREFNTLLQLINGSAVARQVAEALEQEQDLQRALFGQGKPAPAAISRMIVAVRVPQTNLVNVTIRGADKVAVARLLNLVMEQYREYSRTRHLTRARDLRNKAIQEREEANKEKQRALDVRQAFARRNPEVTSYEDYRRTYNAIVHQLETKTTEIGIQILSRKPQVQQARQAAVFGQKMALEFVARDPGIVGLLQEGRRLAGKQRELVEKGMGPEQREVMAVRQRIADNKRELSELVEQQVDGAIRSYENLLEAESSLKKKRIETADAFKLKSLVHQEYQRLEQDVLAADRIWQERNQQVDKSWDAYRLRPDTVMIIAPAEIPHQPLSQQKGITYLFAVLFGLAGGIGMALLLEYLDDTVKTEEDIAGRLDLQMLGFIPFIRDADDRPEARHLVTHTQPKSAVSEAFRTIRTQVVFALQQLLGDQQRGAVIVVTSSQPREGKTTVSSNLAITMAHSGTRVLLIDADLRKPRIHKSFQLDSEIGLTNYLAGAAATEEILQPTGVKNLDAVSSGPLPPNPYELLGSQRMRQLLEELRARYDVLIFDTPPLIFVPDASVLAGAVDGVIHVISAYVTKRKLVAMGKDRVDSIGGRVIGAVLNNVDPAKTDYYYYYYYPGYYRYYSRYYGPDDEEQAPVEEQRRVTSGP